MIIKKITTENLRDNNGEPQKGHRENTIQKKNHRVMD